MSIEVTCIQCGTAHQVNDRLAGRRVRCPNCDADVVVPERPRADVPIAVDALEAVGVEEPSATVSMPKHAHLATSGTLAPSPSAGSADSGIGHLVSDWVAEADDDVDDEPVLARKRRPEEEMDMTPMVDVTFLLLIFFMVTAAFSLQKSIEMPRQQTDAPSTSVQEEEVEELDMVEVQVDEFGSFLVMAPEWERETPGKQNLISALREAIAGSSDGMRLVVKVHELAKLSALVDAMDAGTIAGYSQLEVTQVEGFD